MATKKKKTTKTAKKTTAKKASCKKCSSISSRERAHVCFVTVLSIATGILLCADAAMMIVQ